MALVRKRLSAMVCLVLGVAALAATGCGDDDDDGGGSGGNGDSGALSQQQLDRETASICRDVDRRLEAVETPADITDPEQAVAYFEPILEASQSGLRRLRALEPEESLAADYNAYMASISDQIDFLQGVLEKARNRDPSGLQDLQEQIENPTLQQNTKSTAQEAGLTGCVKLL